MIKTLCSRIRSLDTHTALFFLAHYIAAPRLQYLLRSSPMYLNSTGLQAIDALMRSALTDTCNVSLGDEAWKQASLPVRYGGLGVRSVERLAIPCHLASLTEASSLVSSILSNQGNRYDAILARKPALERLLPLIGEATLPDPSTPGQQRAWDDLASEACCKQLLRETNQVHRARLLAACQPHTAAWLQAVPVPSLGLFLDPESVRIAVALRLGAPICEPHVCRLCSCPADRLGHHALSCSKSAGRFPRHGELNDLVKRSLAASGIPSVLEPTGLDRGDGKRPDGLTTFPFKGGKCLAWDATCTDTFADSSLAKSAIKPGSAARAAEDRKVQRYASLSAQYLFVPLAVETSGVAGPSAIRLVQELGSRITSVTGERRETAWLWQKISIAIIRGNAVAIRGSAYLSSTVSPAHSALPPRVPAFHHTQKQQTKHDTRNISLTPPLTLSPAPPNSASAPSPSESHDTLTAYHTPTGHHDIAPSPPKSISPISTRLAKYRKMYEEMRANFETQDLALSRDPLADPELAPYLVRGVTQCSAISCLAEP